MPVSLSAGTYYDGAIVDDQGQVAESNESNNTLLASNTTSVASAVQKADLIVTSVSIPSSVTSGSSGTFSASIKNQGTAAAGAFRLGYYLSTDSNVTTADALVGICNFTALAAGATNSCTGAVPVSVSVGTYYFGVIVDDLSQVAESNESNNAALGSGTVVVHN